MILPRNPLSSPYYRAPVVLARMAVNLATLVWAVIVLVKPDALAPTNYAWVARYIDEDIIAATLGLIAATHLTWLVFSLPPRRFGSIGYGLLAFSWAFVLAYVSIGGTIQPTATSWVFVGTLLAFYGWISNPRSVRRGELDT